MARPRRFFWAAAYADDGGDVQLLWGKEIWTKLGGVWFRQPDSMDLPDDLLWMGEMISGW